MKPAKLFRALKRGLKALHAQGLLEADDYRTALGSVDECEKAFRRGDPKGVRLSVERVARLLIEARSKKRQ